MNSCLKLFTINDCNEILRKKIETTNYTVESYEFCPLSEKLGFLGDHCFLKIHYKDGKQLKILQLFAKVMCSVESQRIFAIETGAFHKECAIYQELIPKFLENNVHIIKDCIPSCYLVSDMNYIIFEDLKSKGYTTLNQRESMSLDCVKMCLDSLAQFHCAAFTFEERMKAKCGKTYVLAEKFPVLFKETFYSNVQQSRNLIEATKKGVRAEIDLFEDVSQDIDVELFKDLACDIFDQFREIVKPSTVFRNTICHGDLWSFNIMFKFEDGKPVHCYIVDFQSFRYGPPAQDFLGFIHLSTDRQFRQKHMDDMVSYYYKRMAEILEEQSLCIENLLPFVEFTESCDYYKLFSIMQTINHFQLIMVSPETAKSLFHIPNALQQVLFEDKSLLVIQECGKDEIYRRKQLESIIDLKEALLDKGLLKLKD